MSRNQVDQGSANYGLAALVNRVYWHTASPFHVRNVYGCFCSTTLESRQGPHGPQSLKYLPSGHLRKSLLNPELQEEGKRKTIHKEDVGRLAWGSRNLENVSLRHELPQLPKPYHLHLQTPSAAPSSLWPLGNGKRSPHSGLQPPFCSRFPLL